MNIYDLMSLNPGFSFCLMVVLLCTVPHVMFLCWNRLMRHLNIRKHGWPPEHLDADGDFKPAPEVKP